MSKGNKIFASLKNKRFQWIVLIIAVLIYIFLYIPVSYYIVMPGSAIELDTLVEVEDGYEEQGEFMLTSVSMHSGSIISIITSKFDSFMEVIPQELVIDEDESTEDFTKRQLQVMDESQEDAIIAAFSYLELPIDIQNNGVLVMGIVANAPSKDALKIGDLIVKVDDEFVYSVEDILSYFDDKEENDVVKIDFIRDDEGKSAEIPLVKLYNSENQDVEDNKVGLGIYPVVKRTVTTTKNIEFKMDDIGGPSAGLMFSLEIINQMLIDDLTKGYLIAGTGTINSDGEVGQIGSPRLKVKTAAEKGAEIFFVPKDNNEWDNNEKESIQANQDLGNPLIIVPVSNLSEAIEYLRRLTEKNI